MSLSKQSHDIRGKTVRLSWTDGPTKGTTQEHVFHEDGTVEWHAVGKHASTEKPKYASERITDDVSLVSYLSQSGYTLTVALNFETGATVGVASNEKSWMPVHGRFEIVH